MTTIRPFDMGIEETTINGVAIQSISWGKFAGVVPQNPPYYAHIYWNIDYRYYFNDPNSCKPTVVPKPIIGAKSWARQQLVNDRLLRHQYGHYLIGCICALKFQQRIAKTDQSMFKSQQQAINYCHLKFKQTLKQYLKIQKKYDDETDHYYDVQQQQKWEKWIANELNNMIPSQTMLTQQTNVGINKQVESKTEKTTIGSQKSQNKSDKTATSEERTQSRDSKKSRQSSFGKYRSNLSVQTNRRPFVIRSSHNIRIRKDSKVKFPPLPTLKHVASLN